MKSTKYQMAVMPYQELKQFQEEFPFPVSCKMCKMTEIEGIPSYIIVVRALTEISHHEIAKAANRLHELVNASSKFKIMFIPVGYSVEFFKTEGLEGASFQTIGNLYEIGVGDGLMGRRNDAAHDHNPHYQAGFKWGQQAKAKYNETEDDDEEDD